VLLTGFADGIILKSGTPVWESAAAAGADAACLAAAAAAAVVIICSLVCEISAGHSPPSPCVLTLWRYIAD